MVWYLPLNAPDVASIHHTRTSHTARIGALGHHAGEIDTLVLGCTHYPLVALS